MERVTCLLGWLGLKDAMVPESEHLELSSSTPGSVSCREAPRWVHDHAHRDRRTSEDEPTPGLCIVCALPVSTDGGMPYW